VTVTSGSDSLERMHLPLRVAVASVVTLIALVTLVACGGKSDDKKGAGVPTEGRASQIAHAALLETSDLSGEWVLYSTDNFRNDDATLPDTGNCATARNLAADMTKANITRTQRALQLTLPGYTSRAQVEMHIRIFDKAVTAQDFLKRNRNVQTGDSYIRCLADGFSAQFGANARVRSGDAHGKAPRDGVTSAFDQDLKVEDTVYQLHTDSYAWVQNNAYILVLISGPRGLDSNDFVKEALDKAQAKMDAAFKLPQ
jgi:hypothetical protein